MFCYSQGNKGEGICSVHSTRVRQQRAHFTEEDNEALKSHLSFPRLAPSLWQTGQDGISSVAYGL